MSARDASPAPSADEGPYPRIAVLIVDPSPLRRACTIEGLRAAPEFAIEACASISQCDPASRPQLLLFQAGEGGQDETSLSDQIIVAAKRWPGAAALVVADDPGLDEAMAMSGAGAQGLLASNTTMDCMRAAMLLLVNGIGVYPPAILDALSRCDTSTEASEATAQPAGVQHPNTLTKRQGDVLELLALGFSNKAIARQLAISESTVKVHIRAIMAQNGVSNRTQVVAHFLKGPARNG